MSTPRNLTPEVLTTSNILLQIFLLAVQFEDAQNEALKVRDDRHVAKARPDTLEANWGTLLEIEFDRDFTAEKYRAILLGLIRARLGTPSKKSIRDLVLAFAPSATLLFRDFYKDSASFEGPSTTTFFTYNDPSPSNVWNNQTQVWTPGKLLRQLGFDQFGAQVKIVSLGDPADLQFIRHIPRALEFIRPAHQFLALVSELEIV